jgi:hypothetical protein
MRGRTVDIALNPVLVKDVPEDERFVPIMVDMRNVRLTDKGTPVKRKGYAQEWDTGAEESIDALIPDGYAINAIGDIYSLGMNVNKIGGLAPLVSVPTWFRWDNKIYVYAGVSPVKIQGNTVSLVSNGIPNAKFAIMINGYALLAGHHPTRIDWLVRGNPESIVIADGAGFDNIQKNGTVQNMIEYKNRAYVFKERDIEVFAPTGISTEAFRLQIGLGMGTGLGAPNSVVKANDTFYWLGDDGDFYVYGNGAANVLSDQYRARIDEGSNISEWRGFDIRKENCIMWTNPVDGMTILYDYSKNRWLEDSRWEDAGWQALPFASYMELNNKQYFGSRACDGLVHQWSSDSKDDSGQPIRAFRHLKVPLSHNKVRVNRIRFRANRAVATSGETTPEILVRTRFDNGTWKTHEHVSLGTSGDRDPYRPISNVGIGRELEIQISETDSVDFLMTNMFVTFEELRH